MDKIDWANMERGEPLIATVKNMEDCKGIPGVFMLDGEGNEYSATPGDYFNVLDKDKPFEYVEDIRNILVRRMSYLINPLTGDII